jgi:hypothetical protein
VTNVAGTKNGGQVGDVIISWFRPLDESFDGPDNTNQIYMMVVTGLTDSTGSAADCRQEIKLNFAFPSGLTSVVMLDPLTGQLQTNALPIVNTRRQLVLSLDGGDAALFKFANGAPFVGFMPPSSARLGVARTNLSQLTLEGTVGERYRVEATSSLANNSWSVITNVALPNSPCIVDDATATGANQRFYRAVVQ